MTLARILSGGLGLFVTRGATVAVNFMAMLVIAYLMGLSQYGTFAVIWASAQILASIVSQGLPVYLLRAFAIRDRVENNGVSLRFLILRGLVVPVLLCGAGFVPLHLASSELGRLGVELPVDIVPHIFGLALLLNLNTLCSSAFHAFGWQSFSMFQRDALPQVLALICTLAAGTVDVTTGDVVTLLVLLMAAWILLAVVLIIYRAQRHPLLGSSGAGSGRLASFWGSAAIGAALAQIDIVIGSLFLTPAEIGVYNILRRVANLAALPVTIATWATVGDFSRAFATNDRHAIEQTNRKGLILAVPPGLTLVLLCIPMYPVLGIVYELPAGQGAFGTYLILLANSAILIFFANGTTILAASGLETVAFFSRLASIITYVVVTIASFSFYYSTATSNAVGVLLASLVLGYLARISIMKRWQLESTSFMFMR